LYNVTAVEKKKRRRWHAYFVLSEVNSEALMSGRVGKTGRQKKAAKVVRKREERKTRERPQDRNTKTSGCPCVERRITLTGEIQ
jgi:hypothetical protein